MYQTIDETIEVIGIYRTARFHPIKFKWQNQVFPIDQVTFIAEVKDGGVKGRNYSVMSKGTLYRLFFNRDAENWTLKELWVE